MNGFGNEQSVLAFGYDVIGFDHKSSQVQSFATSDRLGVQSRMSILRGTSKQSRMSAFDNILRNFEIADLTT